MIIYVNNILIINFNKIDIKRIKNNFNIKFHILNLKLYIYYLNMIVKKKSSNRHYSIKIIGLYYLFFKSFQLLKFYFDFDIVKN